MDIDYPVYTYIFTVYYYFVYNIIMVCLFFIKPLRL
jgi:hypothetical protein